MNMNENKYLENILESQTLSPDGQEMKDLHSHRDDVERILRKKFEKCSPTIRYGGSKAKGTMIQEAYDLDIICYFAPDDTGAGETLKEIYENVEEALLDNYLVTRKPSALRLKSQDSAQSGKDFHIDVVPGRFIDRDEGDVFLYRLSGEKCRQKTNLDVHIKHVKDSGVVDAIRLLKFWGVRNSLSIRNFILELLTIELLRGKQFPTLSEQLRHVWTQIRDDVEGIKVEDPANPTGNDLSELFNSTIKFELSTTSVRTIEMIEAGEWERVFGVVPAKTSSPLILPGFTVLPRASFGEK
jgi:hypothetical protein